MYIERFYENRLKIHIYEKIIRLVTQIIYTSFYDYNTLCMRFGINIIRIHYSNSCGNSYCIFTFHLHGANEKLVQLKKFEFQIHF
jgi:carbonic anhydrase